MTVLEKIKKCVSLVWDFQEIYGEEDIEDFCRNELRTYPQHDEIMEYFKHIENLEKANEWHSVIDGDLPKHNHEVLCLMWGGTKEIGYYENEVWHFENFVADYEDVDYWQEIVPPKEINNAAAVI